METNYNNLKIIMKARLLYETNINSNISLRTGQAQMLQLVRTIKHKQSNLNDNLKLAVYKPRHDKSKIFIT